MRFYPLSADLPTGEVLLLILLQPQFSIALKTSIVLTFISFRQATFPKGESKKNSNKRCLLRPPKKKICPLLPLGKARKMAINAIYCDPKKENLSSPSSGESKKNSNRRYLLRPQKKENQSSSSSSGRSTL